MSVKTQKVSHIPHLRLRVPHVGHIFRYPKFDIHAKRFARGYALPIIATVTFLIVLTGVVILRIQERSGLIELLPDISEVDESYSSLLSNVKADEFIKNEDNADSQVATNSASRAPAGAPSSFVINTGTTSSAGSTSSSGGGVVNQPFGSSITSFQQASVVLECSGGKQNKGSCSKRYTFSAGVRTVNGPGSVSYSWRSSLQSANQDASFAAGAGTATTTLQKQIVLACTNSATYTLQLVLTSPNSVQSAVLPINHNCNDI